MSSTLEDRPYPCLFFRSVPSETTWSMGRTRSTKFCVVDTQDGVAELIQTIVSVDDAVIFLFLHGSLLAVHPQPSTRVYIIDLDLLGPSALEARQNFSPDQAAAAATADGVDYPQYPRWNDVCRLPSLRAIFESPTIPKVLFDCRGAMSTLHRRYRIELRGVEDIQLMESAGRRPLQAQHLHFHRNRKRQWIMNNATMEEKQIKDGSVGLKEFLMEEGTGNFGWEKQVTDRPLPVEVALYYVNQVRYLPGLRARYLARLDEARRDAVRLRTGRRVREANGETEPKR
ncbi:hypothetical protein VPNG_05216 [Cytospora leucostoma]|uniref:3'-5' exonuclease domain-containing protein n=1 Tax=Cytospora leucostoma TaxID=1230097 RepID=A0A423X8D3_9PEZI|nr:hypothetical protein VPNG_05216 [Cytospora leucostoma]